MEWFYAEDRQQKGPVSEEKFAELVRNGIVHRDTLVWKAGMTNWQPYGQVVGAAAPPPPPPPFTPPPAATGGMPPQPLGPAPSSSSSYHPQMPAPSSPLSPSSSYPTPNPNPNPNPQPASFSGFNTGANNGQRDRALSMVKPPAVCLMILAVLCVYQGLQHLISASQVQIYDEFLKQGFDPQVVDTMRRVHPVTSLVFGVMTLLSAIIMFFGSLRMMNLKNYVLAVMAALFAMLPCSCPCCCLGLGFGIWTLIVLNNPDVKSQFS